MNSFVAENIKNFLKLKYFFRKNVLMFEYVYSSLFPKYFCRVDAYGIKNKLAFAVAHAAYQNRQKVIAQLLEPQQQQQQQQQQQIIKIKQEQIDDDDDDDEKVKVLEEKTTSASVKPAKKRKTKNVNNDKILLNKKKRDEKKVRLLNDLEQNYLQMKRINSNVNK